MEQKIDGFASAGSTGAMMVGCMCTVKQIEGIIRPAISSVIPTDGGEVMLLDVGLNVDCKPEVLCQYGTIGNLYAQGVMHKENPRIALLNIGEEKEKGNPADQSRLRDDGKLPRFQFRRQHREPNTCFPVK